MTECTGGAVTLFYVELRTGDGTTFNICMTSKCCMKNFVPSNNLPADIGSFHVDDCTVEDCTYNIESNVFNYINSL